MLWRFAGALLAENDLTRMLEQPASGAQGYGGLSSDLDVEFVVINGSGRGLRRAPTSERR